MWFVALSGLTIQCENTLVVIGYLVEQVEYLRMKSAERKPKKADFDFMAKKCEVKNTVKNTFWSSVIYLIQFQCSLLMQSQIAKNIISTLHSKVQIIIWKTTIEKPVVPSLSSAG